MKVTDLPVKIKSDMVMSIKLAGLQDMGSDDIISAFLERSSWGSEDPMAITRATRSDNYQPTIVRDFTSFLDGVAWAIGWRMQ